MLPVFLPEAETVCVQSPVWRDFTYFIYCLFVNDTSGTLIILLFVTYTQLSSELY